MGPISPGQNNNKRLLPSGDDSYPPFTVVSRKNDRGISKKVRKGDNRLTPGLSSKLSSDHDYLKVDTVFPNEKDDMDSNINCIETLVETSEMDLHNDASEEDGSDSQSLVKVNGDALTDDMTMNHTCNESSNSLRKQVRSLSKNSGKVADDTNVFRNSSRYLENDPAPYVVIMDSTNHSGNIGNVHPMSLGRKISACKVKGVLELNKIGRNRIKCIFDSACNANNFLDSSFASQNDLTVYIPTYHVQRQGLIRDVDPSILETEVLDDLSLDFDVLSVRRLTKRVIDNNGLTKFVPIPLIVVTFKGKCLPEHVKLFFTKCQVEPYVRPPVQCFNCLRYGHTAKACRSKTRCANCALEHNAQSCPNSSCPCCVFCKGSHSALNKNCPQKYI